MTTIENEIMSCPPTDEVVSLSPVVYNELPTTIITAWDIGKSIA